MGQLAEAPVPSSLLARLLPDVKQEAAVDRLVASNLAERRHTGRGLEVLQLHTTVWDWARELGPRQQPTLMTALQERMAESLKTHDEQVAPLLITHLLTAQRLAEERQQWNTVLDLMRSTVVVLRSFGYWGAQMEMLQRARQAAQNGKNRQTLAQVLIRLGNLYQAQGDYAQARKLYLQSLGFATAIGDRQVISDAILGLGLVASSQGDYAAALQFYEQSQHRTQGDVQLIASILNNRGEVALRQGDFAKAREFFQQSLSLARALGAPHVIARNLVNLGSVAASQGACAEARKYYQQSLDLAQALGDRKVISCSMLGLGNMATSQGDYEAARKYYQQSLDLAQALGDRSVIGRVLAGQGLLAAKTGRSVEARKLLDQAIQIFAVLGDPALAAAQKERAAIGDAP